jgi:hypothetical protein
LDAFLQRAGALSAATEVSLLLWVTGLAASVLALTSVLVALTAVDTNLESWLGTSVRALPGLAGLSVVGWLIRGAIGVVWLLPLTLIARLTGDMANERASGLLFAGVIGLGLVVVTLVQPWCDLARCYCAATQQPIWRCAALATRQLRRNIWPLINWCSAATLGLVSLLLAAWCSAALVSQQPSLALTIALVGVQQLGLGVATVCRLAWLSKASALVSTDR